MDLNLKILSTDVETTTKNKGHPFTPENRLVSVAYTEPSLVDFKYHSDPDFRSANTDRLSNADVLIGFNIKFDLHWFRRDGIILDVSRWKIWDVQLAEFVLNGQRGAYQSLNDVLASYGLPLKYDKVKDYWTQGIDTIDIPVPILKEYNLYDTSSCLEVFYLQQQAMSEKQKKLVWLLGEDLKTLQDAEYNGFKWNSELAKEKHTQYAQDVAKINERLATYLPDIKFGSFNFDSGDHLSVLLYGGTLNFDYAIPEQAVYKSGERKGEAYTRNRWYVESITFPQRFKPIEGSETKKTKNDLKATTRFYQTDAPTLLQLKSRKKEDMELLDLLRERSDKVKVLEMITSIEKKRTDLGWENDLLHAQFNQNVVITGRLSSSNPNMQNTPVEIDELLISRYEA